MRANNLGEEFMKNLIIALALVTSFSTLANTNARLGENLEADCTTGVQSGRFAEGVRGEGANPNDEARPADTATR
jgi:hypothetical protein